MGKRAFVGQNDADKLELKFKRRAEANVEAVAHAANVRPILCFGGGGGGCKTTKSISSQRVGWQLFEKRDRQLDYRPARLACVPFGSSTTGGRPIGNKRTRAIIGQLLAGAPARRPVGGGLVGRLSVCVGGGVAGPATGPPRPRPLAGRRNTT